MSRTDRPTGDDPPRPLVQPRRSSKGLALVESPAQLLNLLEYARGHAQQDVEVAVLRPRDAGPQLAEMIMLAEAEGLPVACYDIRGGVAGRARAVAALTARMAAARRLVLGDPYSRLVQTLLPCSRARDMVVVDDGTATLDLVTRLADGRPLVRWHQGGRSEAGGSLGRAWAGGAVAARRLRPRQGRSVEVFTSFEVAVPDGVRLSVNRYDWIRRRFGPPVTLECADLVGTSLVETGLVHRDRYIAGVAELAVRYGARRYLAHRREDPEKLRELRAVAEIEIVRPALPLEVELRRGPVARTIVTLPSTVAHTLPQVLSDVGVRVMVRGIETDWFTSAADPGARAFLDTVVTTARERHGLLA